MHALLDLFRRGPWRYVRDRDVLHSLAVTLAALLLTCGLLWLVYLRRVWRMAARSPSQPAQRGVVLVFGCRLRNGLPKADYRHRLRRCAHIMRAGLARRVVLLGGASSGSGSTTESAAGARWLRTHGPLPDDVELILEQTSIDSLENLRHARIVLNADPLPPVVLVSSRYHLARCQLLARCLGFEGRPVGAEPRMPRHPAYMLRILMEAGYLMWIDIGLRWARLIGHRRMLSRMR